MVQCDAENRESWTMWSRNGAEDGSKGSMIQMRSIMVVSRENSCGESSSKRIWSTPDVAEVPIMRAVRGEQKSQEILVEIFFSGGCPA
jgi:hypothetical protein